MAGRCPAISLDGLLPCVRCTWQNFITVFPPEGGNRQQLLAPLFDLLGRSPLVCLSTHFSTLAGQFSPPGRLPSHFHMEFAMSNQLPVDQVSILDDKLALVTINIKCFSGYRRASRDNIKEMGGNLPNSEAVTEGSIKVFPGERLNVFSTLRRSVFRKVAAMGVKALGSGNTFAVPRDELSKLDSVLLDAEKDYHAELAVLAANYEPWFEEHVKANPEAESIIRKLQIPGPVALTRFGFSSHTFKIVPISKAGEMSDVSTIVEGLARQLFEEVAAEAAKLLDKSDAFNKHQKAGQKTLRPIKEAALKMKGLEFLDPIITSGIKLIEDTLSALPQVGYIEDSAFAKPYSTLKRLLDVLSDVDSFVDAAGRVANGIAVDNVLFPALHQAASIASLVPVNPTAPHVQVDLSLDADVLPEITLGDALAPNITVISDLVSMPTPTKAPAFAPEFLMF